eukprot:5626504-Prorocentrum_lima.AAC.1
MRDASVPLILRRCGFPPAMAAGWATEFWRAQPRHEQPRGPHVGTTIDLPEPVGLLQAKQEAGQTDSARRLWACIRGPYPTPVDWVCLLYTSPSPRDSTSS